MNQATKTLSKLDSNHIQKLLSENKGDLFVKLKKIEEQETIDTIFFEYIDGTHDLSDNDLQDFFFQLGKDHRVNQRGTIKISENLAQYGAFTTILHGDVHLKNIIKSEHSFKLIDLTMIKVGINFDDLDYLDLLDLFDKEKFPWIIKDNNFFDAYLNGVDIKLNEGEKEQLKKILAKRFLQRYIDNGKKNNNDISYEEELLKSIKE